MRSVFGRRIALACVLGLVVGILCASGCSKAKPPTAPAGPGAVAGSVIDASTSLAVAGATVSSGSAQVTTGANGLFSLSLAAGTAAITVSKAGYTLNQLVVSIAPGATRQVTVGLLGIGAAEPVTVASGGSVTDPGTNAVISLPPNFVTASGDVTVSITGLDPTTGDIRALPGGLDAVDASGQPVYLNPVSFAEYTVRDAAGNILPFNSSAGAGADIELPIPVSLRGKPGYGMGDPIECYLYDPADGKWKTPVAGVIGPSTVDGSPAIKATIFHLSWYGGAPASNDRACIDGYVKNLNGTPAAGVGVEAFTGGAATTDAQGYYRVDASPNGVVRVVATRVTGTTIQSGEIEVHTAAAGTTCNRAPDITLGTTSSGTFEVLAYLVDGNILDALGEPIRALGTDILLVANGVFTNYTEAKVEVSGGGGSWIEVPFHGSGPDSGFYAIHHGTGGFAVTAGQQYSIRIDYDRNGTIDANGQVRMVGVPVVSHPPDGGTVGATFTATWNDPASALPGYAPSYLLELIGTTGYFQYLTTSRSKVIGDGIPDSTVYGYPQPNDPLVAGGYTMDAWAFDGSFPYFGLSGFPNISGQNTEGFFVAIGVGPANNFTSTGVPGARAVARRGGPARLKRPPLDLTWPTMPSLRERRGVPRIAMR